MEPKGINKKVVIAPINLNSEPLSSIKFYKRPGHLSPRHFLSSHYRNIWEECKNKINSVDFIKTMIALKVNPKALDYLKGKYPLE